MRRIFILIVLVFSGMNAISQQNATFKEYYKHVKTYPYSDPDPIPNMDPLRKIGTIYPYYRYDGYTNKSQEKEWKIIEIENDYIKILILPELGGKIWTAIEKSTDQPFIYYNQVIKFRDVAIRGPWTSGGFEYNYGVYGHTPSCVSPIDYKVFNRSDGSVSCIIQVLDLFTRTTWQIDVNLPKDKAYFTTSSFWYNSSSVEQPYYTWMNVGIKAEGNLEFIYPGTQWIEHNGQVYNWPINEQNGKNISFYENNDFGNYKSYHVFGKHSEFFGGYWHDDGFGMGRYSTRDEKIGKKIWIWGKSQQGMLWEKLLTDNDGQYVELQSGRLFNQHWEESTLTPFKRKGFLPHTTDKWTEYWFPVLKTRGFIAANNYGALNLIKENGWLKIYFSSLQRINDPLIISGESSIIYSKNLSLEPLELYCDSFRFDADKEHLRVSLGDKKLEYKSLEETKLNRPTTFPDDFNYDSVYGLYLLAKQNLLHRDHITAEEQLRSCLEKDPNYLPALTDMSMLLYNKMKYEEALFFSKRALSINTYDPAANYYYGLINYRMGKIADAKDGFEVASLGIEYRNASWSMLSGLYLKEMDLSRSVEYALKSVGYNHYDIDSYKLLAVNYRLQKDKDEADKILDTILSQSPLNHFARFEKHLWENSEKSKINFLYLIRNEIPHESFLELAIWYFNIGRIEESVKLLELAPQNAEVIYWQAFLTGQQLSSSELKPDFVFPFRQETAKILEKLLLNNNSWLLKYNLALIHWNLDNIQKATYFFSKCEMIPDYSPFYVARAKFSIKHKTKNLNALSDLKYAIELDPFQWRAGRELAVYHLSEQEFEEALIVSEQYYNRFPENYYLGLLYSKALIWNKHFEKAEEVLNKIEVLPNEGATEGRKLYKETQLMLALEEIKAREYKKGLKHIKASRLWPENLGVGKPYSSDIDERLEDWLAYECYTKLADNKNAQKMLDRIISFKPVKTAYVNTFNSVNNLVTAWTMQQLEKKDEAEAFLQDWLNKDPNNSTAKWVNKAFKEEYFLIQEKVKNDEDYRILNSYIDNFVREK